MSGHLDGPPPGPPDPPYIPGDLGAPSAKEFARRRAGDRHMSDTIRLCVQTHHPIDPGNYEGPIHCTACPEGTPCVTALYVRQEEVNDLRDQVQMDARSRHGLLQSGRRAGHLRVGERHVPGARVPLTRAGARSRTRFDALRRADRGGA